jgi:hypothetical protein
MPDNRYSADIVQTRSELDQAIQERDRANVKIISLQAKLRALLSLYNQQSLVPEDTEVIGLTEAIRSVLRLANKPMQASEVKTNLDVMGFNFTNSSNPSAAVHNTLKRLAATRELVYTMSGYRFSLGEHARQLRERLDKVRLPAPRKETPTSQEAAEAQAKALVQKRGLAPTRLTNPMSRQGKSTGDKD